MFSFIQNQEPQCKSSLEIVGGATLGVEMQDVVGKFVSGRRAEVNSTGDREHVFFSEMTE